MGLGRKRFTEPTLKNWDEVELHMKEIGELDIQMQAAEAEMNTKISDIKLQATMDVKPMHDRREKLALEIKEFVENNRTDIEGKTKQLNFGKLGFRQSTSIILHNTIAIIKALKNKAMLDCINVKETVNKDVLRGYSDEEIASVGARKKVEDVFWLEPDYEKLKG